MHHSRSISSKKYFFRAKLTQAGHKHLPFTRNAYNIHIFSAQLLLHIFDGTDPVEQCHEAKSSFIRFQYFKIKQHPNIILSNEEQEWHPL